VTILGPPIDWQQDAFGNTQDSVNLGVDFLGPCIAPDGKDSAVRGGQAHGHDLVGTKTSNGFFTVHEGFIEWPAISSY
jgi:hypothetical protein